MPLHLCTCNLREQKPSTTTIRDDRNEPANNKRDKANELLFSHTYNHIAVFFALAKRHPRRSPPLTPEEHRTTTLY